MHLSHEQRIRYGRHTQLPEVGEEGQVKLLQSRVLLVGAGGLGSPVALYLAAAGVGTLGIVDYDSVSLSNLQRQVIHNTVGKLKAPSVTEAIQRLTPDVSVREYIGRLDSSTVDQYFDVGWHVVIDAVDNLETRYLINEACTKRKIPWVHGAVSQYEGQVTTFNPEAGGPCYRCLYPDLDGLDKATSKPSGVLGVVPGVVGTLQATEALKVILGLGQTLEGLMLNYDARYMSFNTMSLRERDPNCPVCSIGSAISSPPRELTFEVALSHNGCLRTYEADSIDSLGAAKLVLWCFAPSGRYNVTVTCAETGSREEFTVDRPNEPPTELQDDD